MKELRQKAETGPDATRMKNAEGESFVVLSPALYDAESISPEDEYPFHGDWFETEDGYLECPSALARRVVHAVDVDDFAFPLEISIEHTEKSDSEWVVEALIEPAEE